MSPKQKADLGSLTNLTLFPTNILFSFENMCKNEVGEEKW